MHVVEANGMKILLDWGFAGAEAFERNRNMQITPATLTPWCSHAHIDQRHLADPPATAFARFIVPGHARPV